MNITLDLFLQVDLPALLAATLAAATCALLGNFLVLRRLSLMGDAIAHAVLPGIVVVFLIASTRSTLPVILGAAAAGLLTTILTELVRKIGRVESSASMGVVFSILFALGVVLLEQAAADHVDLDADCVLYGQLEDVSWFAPVAWTSFLELETWRDIPREVATLAIVFFVSAFLVTLFFKELTIAAFDSALATTLGFRASLLHYGLMALVALAAVASFEAVGSILVIAMIICPPATARMLTDRITMQVWLSLLFAVISAVLGYGLAAFGPGFFGGEHALSAAGMMTVVAGALMTLAIVASPSHGVIARRVHQSRLAASVVHEDLLALLYRFEETQQANPTVDLVHSHIRRGAPGISERALRAGFRSALKAGEITKNNNRLELSSAGRARAMEIVRTHRLWERFLVDEMGSRPDHVHRTATTLEHLTTQPMERELEMQAGAASRDPHDRPIPPKPAPNEPTPDKPTL